MAAAYNIEKTTERTALKEIYTYQEAYLSKTSNLTMPINNVLHVKQKPAVKT